MFVKMFDSYIREGQLWVPESSRGPVSPSTVLLRLHLIMLALEKSWQVLCNYNHLITGTSGSATKSRIHFLLQPCTVPPWSWSELHIHFYRLEHCVPHLSVVESHPDCTSQEFPVSQVYCRCVNCTNVIISGSDSSFFLFLLPSVPHRNLPAPNEQHSITRRFPPCSGLTISSPLSQNHNKKPP